MRWNSKTRVVVDEIEQQLGAQHETRDHLVRVQGLALAVDHAGLDQLDHAVGHHFGVDAQVLVVVQQAEHGFGNAADAGLDGGAIGNQRRHVARDGAVHVR